MKDTMAPQSRIAELRSALQIELWQEPKNIFAERPEQSSGVRLATNYPNSHEKVLAVFIRGHSWQKKIMTKNSLCSWSGGKDSCFALMQAINLGYVPKVLLNVLNEEGKISRSHGIPYSILQEQANVAGLHLHCISSSWAGYEMHFTNALKELKDGFKISHAVFGDIDLQAHRDWEEKVCTNAGLNAVLPLWKQDRRTLVMQMLEAGIQTIIVSCNETMGERFIGQLITPALIDELELLGIDACGENGEYHTLVLDCPLFSFPIDVGVVETVKHERYWFGKLL